MSIKKMYKTKLPFLLAVSFCLSNLKAYIMRSSKGRAIQGFRTQPKPLLL